MTTSPPQLLVENLHKAFGRQAPVLRGVELAVPQGSLVAILGPSGSGKTTLLRVLAGFERVGAGRVILDGCVVDDGHAYVPPERRGVGYVAQEGGLFPHLTVEGNVGFGLRRGQVHGLAESVGALLEMVGLAGMERRYPHQLSGGQQQRVALARALAVQPSVLLLDEPFAALDAGLRSAVRADVQRALQTTGTTAILVTHDQEEALSTANFVAVLREGRLAQFGTPRELYARPADPEVARFVGEANLVQAVLSGDSASTTFGLLPLHGDCTESLGPGVVLIRPEQVELSLGLDGPGLPGQVVSSRYHGHDAVVVVRLQQDNDVETLVSRAAGNVSLLPETRVLVRVRGPVHAWAGPS